MNDRLLLSNINSLHWVRGELEQSLVRVRGLIEHYIDSSSDSLTLQQAVAELQTVRGTLHMIQRHGAAIATEEMSQTLLDLLYARVKEVEVAYSTLLGATVLLADYIGALAEGMDDSALVLQPVINELRLARGQAVVTETDLFVIQMKAVGLALPAAETLDGADAQKEARKLLLVFQTSLLHWLKNDAEAANGLARMGKIAVRIEGHTQEPRMRQLWRTLAAVVEALLTRTLEESLDLKRLVGAAAQEIRLLAQGGEDAAVPKLGDLAWQLLFFAGRSRGQGPRIAALREQFQLHSYLPPDSQVLECRRRIRGPNTSLLLRVSEEIHRDFTEVKDQIDLVVRGGGKAGAGLVSARERLSRIAATLATLGLPVLQRVINNQVRLIESLGDAGAGSALWMDVAMSILRVEHSLDDALFHQLQFDAGANVRRPELEDSVPHSRDLAEGRAALLREAMVNLARFKTSTDAYVRGAESAMAAEAPRLLTEISSAFHILQIERASTLVAQLERYVRSTGFAEVRTNGERAERFADAVALVEYYLEDAGRGGIAQAESLLDRLAGYVEELEIAEEPAAAVEAQVAEILGTEPQAALPPEAFTAPEEPVPSSPAEPQAPPPVDPEIRDIFLDEAAEVRAELERALPYLRRDAQDKEQLTVVRRAFHTLKGSGRMVGAGHVGDFGWALESMLNHCLDGSISTSPEVVEVVGEAVALLPGLIEGFRNGEPPDVRIGPLMEHARNIARGRTAAEEASGMAAIFREDALEKLGSVMRWLRRQHPDQGEYEVNDEVVRAFHTLRGAAHVVRAPAISELSGALETYLDSTRGAGLALPQKALDLLDSASGTLRDWVEAVGSPAVQMQDSSSWLERIREVQSQVPEQAVQASADRELAEIFSSEALDLVQKIEQTAGAWSRAPQNLQAAGEIKTLCHTLQGAALMSKCRPLADVARGLHARMDRAIREEHALPAEFFGETSGVIESMYQLLDRYREGSLTDETAAQIVHAFEAERPSAAHAGGGAEPDAAAEIPPAAQPEPDEALIEMLPVADVPWNEDGAPLADGDGELRAIFVGEAYELLESLDGHAAAWERQPGSTESGNEIKRVLHTLKGSARMAGFPGIGEVSQHLESRVAEALYAGTGDHALFAQLQQGSDGLHRMLLDFEQGRLPDAAGLITALDAVVEQGTEPVSLSVQQAALPETPPSRIEFDPDLAEVFAGEAGELIESMQASLTAWRQHPDDAAHGREMLRALHTLKGGAHMAGLQDMGNAAHNMESLIEAMEQQGSAGAAALDSLAADLEGLQHLHDRLVRGDTAGQHVVPEAAPVPAASFDDHDELAVTAGKPAQTAIAVPAGWSPQLFWKPEEDAGGLAAMRRETARVPVESLDSMLNQAGEISIYRSRMEEQSTTLQTQLGELAQAITRLREQLRMLDIETEAQIAARGMGHAGTQHDRYSEHFDPLEMDRFTRMQELSRALAESVGDLSALHATMDQLEGEADTLLLQQGRINTELQQGLMRTLMVPFSRQVARLQRVVRQVAQDNGKQVEAQFNGIESELDRNVLERMTAPLEHLLRNAVVHGIGTAEQRIAVGKPAGGTVTVSLRREGTQLLIEVRDDGQGLNLDAIRATAVKRGLMPEDARISDDEVAQFIFEPGFSTAGKLTKDAGRGVGMDVVAAQVRQLGGTLELGSERGRGARFLIRLPLNLAISQALLVTVGAEMYAIPLTSIEGIARIPHEQIDSLRGESGTLYNYGGHDYRMNYLGDFIGTQHDLPEDSKTVTAILVRIGEGIGAQERRVGVFVDALQGNREIVSKSVGPQLSTVTGVSGATILADGRVVLILDIVALTLDRTRRALISLAAGKAESATAGGDTRDLVMVVDDSITIRRVTERLLLKNGYRVVTAKDGLDAMAQLQTEHPAAVLLDIEMPRADGFEVATFIRNSERIGKLPIIMITSRSGDKHRERAAQIGVNRYLIKPFQEEQLMGEVRDVIREAAL